MRCLRAGPAILLVVALTACGPDEGPDGGGSSDGGGGSSQGGGSSDGGGSAGDTSTDPGPRTVRFYQVQDSECPPDYPYGLTVATDVAAEVEYLDDIPACTNAGGTGTWLNNRSDVVWSFKNNSTVDATVDAYDPSPMQRLTEASFLGIAQPSTAILMPDAKVAINLPPSAVQWVINLDLTFGWMGHDVVVDKIASAGEAAAVAALTRKSRAGGALVTCTLAVVRTAQKVPDLADADSSDILVDGLEAGAEAAACRAQTRAVQVNTPSGSTIALADDLATLRSQAELLDGVHVRADYAQRSFKFVALGLKFLHK